MNETELNNRYTEIRKEANDLMDKACQNPKLFDDQDWINAHFDLNCEYNGICDQLKTFGYTDFESFPGNEND